MYGLHYIQPNLRALTPGHFSVANYKLLLPWNHSSLATRNNLLAGKNPHKIGSLCGIVCNGCQRRAKNPFATTYLGLLPSDPT